MAKKNELDSIRAQISQVDTQIVEALAQRQRLIEKVTEAKTSNAELRDVERESQHLTTLIAQAKKLGVDDSYVTRLFREIFEHSLRHQQERIADTLNPERVTRDTIVVAYQGTNGAYSEMAGAKHFGPRDVDAVFRGYDSFAEMLEAVAQGKAKYGVLPIENTTAGSINEAYDLLARMNLFVVGEEVLRVQHCLVALPGVKQNEIRRVFSHPQALAQCTHFLASLPDCTVEAFTDTAMSVKRIRAENIRAHAAVASEQAAALYGLNVLKHDIANQKENFTRFMIVATEPAKYDARFNCKTSLIFATQHEQGALVRCLNALAKAGLNLTKLESRPRPNAPWEYLFYVDFEGNRADAKVKTALARIDADASYLKVLGSYPARTTEQSRVAVAKKPSVSAAAKAHDSKPKRARR